MSRITLRTRKKTAETLTSDSKQHTSITTVLYAATHHTTVVLYDGGSNILQSDLLSVMSKRLVK